MSFAADFPNLSILQSLGEPVILTTPEAVELETWAVIETNVEIMQDFGQVTNYKATAALAVSEVGAVQVGSTIKTESGAEYLIDGLISNDGGIVSVYCR